MAESDRARLRVLFVTPECHPLVKTGGLGDVAAALPPALAALGVDVRLLIPGYPQVMQRVEGLRHLAQLPPHAMLPEAGILAGFMPSTKVPVYVIDCPALFNRAGGPYSDARGVDWPDNHVRFGLLSRAAAEIGRGAALADWKADVVNCQDWQAGLAPLYLRLAGAGRPRSVMTIHNLAYQGVFPPSVLPALGLPMDTFTMHGAEYYGNLSFLKAGLFYADRLSTVSPTYAREIQQEPLGFGMHGLLAGRAAHLRGILNGIDTGTWDPAHDPHLAAPYGPDSLAGKRDNKIALLRAVGLPVEPDRMLLGVVSRLTPQKGLDLVLEIVPRLGDVPAALVVQGTGDPVLEQAFREATQRWPGTLAVRIGYDEAFAHQIEAGADLFLMPSRFEPCGLNQMYSQRYGTPPVVNATGGLADSVVAATPASIADGTGTGFVCGELAAPALLQAIRQAEATRRDPAAWRRLQRNGMARDFSWAQSAREYLALFLSANA